MEEYTFNSSVIVEAAKKNDGDEQRYLWSC